MEIFLVSYSNPQNCLNQRIDVWPFFYSLLYSPSRFNFPFADCWAMIPGMKIFCLLVPTLSKLTHSLIKALCIVPFSLCSYRRNFKPNQPVASALSIWCKLHLRFDYIPKALLWICNIRIAYTPLEAFNISRRQSGGLPIRRYRQDLSVHVSLIFLFSFPRGFYCNRLIADLFFSIHRTRPYIWRFSLPSRQTFARLQFFL